ncbi:MAG: leucyl/phenylalanyl-tRNA--protein transferase [Hyphomicrobiaceae bacterium]|nr:leucyl/phenylalanyl-tRNA--protein transferase [Hyphomicrobiaceae bacterium]
MTTHNPFIPELNADLILRAYQAGIFPMADSADDPDIFWVSPEHRGIIPLDGLHVSKSLRKAIRTTAFETRVDSDFELTIENCATKGTERETTWINSTIRRLYGELFERGYCHTVEVWDGAEMVGGLYGIAIGGAFFGESMFHTRTNASKIALVHLVDRLNAGNFRLLDTQFLTDHLESLGAIEIPRSEYELRLAKAMEVRGDFGAWDHIAGRN